MFPASSTAKAPADSAIVAKATLRAADRLAISSKSLAKILGVSEATVSRVKSGAAALDSKSLEIAIEFVRLYRSLDAIAGGDDAVAGAWLKNHNTALRDKPAHLIETISGLTNVIQYLDARRAVV